MISHLWAATIAFRPDDYSNVTAQQGLAFLSLAKLIHDEERRQASIREAIRLISYTVKSSPTSSIAIFLGDRFSQLEGSSPSQATSVLNYPLGKKMPGLSLQCSAWFTPLLHSCTPLLTQPACSLAGRDSLHMSLIRGRAQGGNAPTFQ